MLTFGDGQQPHSPSLRRQHVFPSGHDTLLLHVTSFTWRDTLAAVLRSRGVDFAPCRSHVPALTSHVVPCGQQCTPSEQHTACMETDTGRLRSWYGRHKDGLWTREAKPITAFRTQTLEANVRDTSHRKHLHDNQIIPTSSQSDGLDSTRVVSPFLSAVTHICEWTLCGTHFLSSLNPANMFPISNLLPTTCLSSYTLNQGYEYNELPDNALSRSLNEMRSLLILFHLVQTQTDALCANSFRLKEISSECQPHKLSYMQYQRVPFISCFSS